MTTTLEKSPETNRWINYGTLLYRDAIELSALQNQAERSWDKEQEVAQRTISYLQEATSSWHPDFQPVVWVTSDRVFRSSWYPPTTVKDNENLMKSVKDKKKTFELTVQEGGNLQGYLGSFTQGQALGYEKELGDKWYLTLSWSGTLYVPVENIQEIKGIGW